MGFRELKTKSGLRELILEKIPFWRRREEKIEKRVRAREGSIFGWDCFPFLASKRSCKKQEGKRLRLQVQRDLR